MSEVILVGCGNIGTRLLQSLLTGVEDVRVTCVDPQPAARDLALQRAAEVGQESAIKVLADIPTGAAPDLAIVATTSGPRRAIVETLIERVAPKLFLLEKFLFPFIADYEVVASKLEAIGASAFVHTPRPVWPGYKDLREMIVGSNDPLLHMRVSGQQWNMASNAIHFVPAFEALAKEPIIEWDSVGLDPVPLPNKREGYLEVTGTLRGKTASGAELVLESFREDGPPLGVSVKTAKHSITINEGAGEMVVTPLMGGAAETKPFAMLRASEMQDTVSKLLQTGACDLPLLGDLAGSHIALIQHFNTVFFGENSEAKACPVT